MKHKRNILIVISSLIGALLMIHLMGSVVVDLGGIQFSSKLLLSNKGYTVLSLPPLGMLKASTHDIPLVLNFTLKNINLDFIKGVIENLDTKEDLLILLRENLTKVLWRLALKVVIVSAVGSLLAGRLMGSNRKQMMISLIIGILVPVIILSSIFINYNIHAFNTPEFKGALEAAPWVIGLFNNGLERIRELEQHLQMISGNISQVFAKMDHVQPLEGSQIIKVLHVSDIHNNPAAVEFMEHIVNGFKVHFIVDTGDITDYGTPFEDLLIKKISTLPVPYVFVAGNHDSEITVQMLRELDNVTVLDDARTIIEGIELLGFADPNSKTAYINSPDDLEKSALTSLIRREVNRAKPDILVVHNPDISEEFVGKVPVILNGHTHQLSFSQREKTSIINAGTTGAAGIRGFQSTKDIPYSSVLLYFEKDDKSDRPTLIALDIIKIPNLKAGFEIQRAFFNQDALP